MQSDLERAKKGSALTLWLHTDVYLACSLRFPCWELQACPDHTFQHLEIPLSLRFPPLSLLQCTLLAFYLLSEENQFFLLFYAFKSWYWAPFTLLCETGMVHYLSLQCWALSSFARTDLFRDIVSVVSPKAYRNLLFLLTFSRPCTNRPEDNRPQSEKPLL